MELQKLLLINGYSPYLSSITLVVTCASSSTQLVGTVCGWTIKQLST
jgi:hypothetical protein